MSCKAKSEHQEGCHTYNWWCEHLVSDVSTVYRIHCFLITIHKALNNVPIIVITFKGVCAVHNL